jgi:hypothetical protein
MVDVGQALLTATLTTGFGAVAYFGHRWFLDPILEQRRIIGRIAHALTFFANVYFVRELATANTADELRAAQLALRKLAADLRENRRVIPAYSFLARCGLIVGRAELQCAASELIGWSNSLCSDGGDRFERRHRVAQYLGISADIDVTPGTRDVRVLSSHVQAAYAS